MTFVTPLLLLASLLTWATDATRLFPAIFTFGDSTVDVGTNKFLNQSVASEANFYPYGFKFVPASGRFSDGKIVGDFLAKYSGLAIAPPYLQPQRRIKNGLNFGSGGSRLFYASSCKNDTACVTMQTQLVQFASVYKLYSANTIAKSLYFISNGGNDYLDVSKLVFAGVKVNISEAVTNIVTALSSSVQTLYGYGARKFIVAEVPAIGCVPSALFLAGVSPTKPACIPAVNALAQAHNSALAGAVSLLRANLPNIHISVAKIFNFTYQISNNPTAFGFKVGFNACCGGLAFNGGFQCGKYNYTQCRKSSTHVYWDGLHTTQGVYNIIAKALFDGDSNFVTPVGVKDLAKL